MSNSIKTSSICQTPRSSLVIGRSRDTTTGDGLNSCITSRRDSCCTEKSQQYQSTYNTQSRSQWSSYRTDVTGCSQRTPISHGKFRTNFSYRKAEIPSGYPKSDDQRNPRRESVVSEFSRKIFEGYDIWEDEDRPVINWKFPQLPIRSNKTHELRKFANREKMNKMLEREKQMNKRSSRFAAPSEKKDTAWWEKSKNGIKGQPSTPRVGQANRGWTSNVTVRSNFVSNKSAYTPRRI